MPKTAKKAHDDDQGVDLVDGRTGEVLSAGKVAVKIVSTLEKRVDTKVYFPEQGKTHQEFKDECDINLIMKRWRKTGEVPHVNPGAPWYGDFTEATDYFTAVQRIDEAEEHFMSLPADVRSVAENNPGKFLELLGSEEGQEKLEAAGLPIAREKPEVPAERDNPPPPSQEAEPPTPSASEA